MTKMHGALSTDLGHTGLLAEDPISTVPEKQKYISNGSRTATYLIETAVGQSEDIKRRSGSRTKLVAGSILESTVSAPEGDGVKRNSSMSSFMQGSDFHLGPGVGVVTKGGIDDEDNKVVLNNANRMSCKSLPMHRRSTRDSIRHAPYHPGKHARIMPVESDSSSISSSSTSSLKQLSRAPDVSRARTHSFPSHKSIANNKDGSSENSIGLSQQRLAHSTTDLPVRYNQRNSVEAKRNIVNRALAGSLASLNIHTGNEQTHELEKDRSGRRNTINNGALKRSESAALEIQKMRQSLLQKREMKRKQKKFLDDDKVLVGNKVTEGHVNFIIAYNMLTGIRVAVSRCSGIMKPLTDKDFRLTKKLAFDYHGNELTPSSQYAFKFKDYSPEVFRELRALFGLDPADYLMSLTSKYVLSELNSPGKSGSFFYYSRDYKYIIKTIHHSEHRHLRKILKRYYEHVKSNPDTLISQFYGLHRIKMPITFRSKIKYRKIYFLVMNNLFPPHLQIHTTFDLKGSTWGRYTKVDKNEEAQHSPVYKDLNWIEMKESINLGPLKSKKFIQQLEKDVSLLSELNIMDYSLLLGIHNIEKGNDLIDENRKLELADYQDDHPTVPNLLSTQHSNKPTHLHTHSHSHSHTHNHPHHRRHTQQSVNTPGNNTQVVKHFFQQDEGGIRASDQFNNDLNQIYFVGIIDCLTNYSLVKRLETLWRGMNHDLKVVSAVPPKAYGDRFYTFIKDSVNKHYYQDNLQHQN